MKNIIFASTLLFFISCKKNDPGNITKDPNNHMEAVVTFTSGSPVTINETGQNVTMGVGAYGETSAQAINSQKYKVGISSGFNTNEGYYEPFDTNSNGAYRSYNAPGDTIIYTVISGSHREGNFNFRCKNTLADTVRITGSFKGRFGL